MQDLSRENSELVNNTRNDLTEVYNKYKLLSPNILYCYCRLPNVLSKVATYIFNTIINSKFYSEDDKNNAKGHHEGRRIYSDYDISIERIIRNISDHNTSVDGSYSNAIRYVKQLDALNVIYFWRYKGKYVFIMERELGCWKFYNEYGVVIPRTLKKIVDLSQHMIGCMKGFLLNGEKSVDEDDLDRSFGLFVNRMIDKMHPSVAHGIKKFDGKDGLGSYLLELSGKLELMDRYDGLSEHDDFIAKLPADVGEELLLKRKTGAGEMKKCMNQEMENELIPKNPNLGRKRRGRPVKNSNVVSIAETQGEKEGIRATVLSWDGNISPVKNSRTFVEYYRAFLRNHNNNINFDVFADDTDVAAKILDLLIDNRLNNKQFVDAWLRYYVENFLRGERTSKTKHTSLRTLMVTFEKFHPLYLVPISL